MISCKPDQILIPIIPIGKVIKGHQRLVFFYDDRPKKSDPPNDSIDVIMVIFFVKQIDGGARWTS